MLRRTLIWFTARLGFAVQSDDGDSAMQITVNEFREYVEANQNRKIYETSRGAPFSFELLKPRSPNEGFPYTIRFKWPSWSESTVRRCGPADILRFLEEFNANNYRSASEYRNRKGQGEPSRRAGYLIVLFRDLAEQKVRDPQP